MILLKLSLAGFCMAFYLGMAGLLAWATSGDFWHILLCITLAVSCIREAIYVVEKKR